MRALFPTGQILSVAGNPHGFLGPWGFQVFLRRGAGTIALTSGTVGSFEACMRLRGELGKLKVRTATLGRARIRAFENHRSNGEGGTHFMWSGQHHEVLHYVKAFDVPLDRFQAVLGNVSLTDTPLGVRILPRRGTSVRTTRLVGFNNIEFVGSIQVLPAAESADAIPRWRGRRVPGGELWRQDDSVDRRIAVLANASAHTTIIGGDDRDGKLARLAQTMRVELVDG